MHIPGAPYSLTPRGQSGRCWSEFLCRAYLQHTRNVVEVPPAPCPDKPADQAHYRCHEYNWKRGVRRCHADPVAWVASLLQLSTPPIGCKLTSPPAPGSLCSLDVIHLSGPAVTGSPGGRCSKQKSCERISSSSAMPGPTRESMSPEKASRREEQGPSRSASPAFPRRTVR